MAIVYSTGFTGIALDQAIGDFDPNWVLHPTTTYGYAGSTEYGGTLYAKGASQVCIVQAQGAGTFADCHVTVRFVHSVGGTSASSTAVIARADATVRSHYGARAVSGNFELFKRTNGTNAVLGSVPHGKTSPWDFVLGVKCVGNQIYLTVDGVDTLGPITDNSFASGYGGLYATGVSASTNAILMDDFSIDDLVPGGSDTTAPTLTSPSATATGTTTASGSVTTDEANGTLYYLVSANASESVATVKAGSSQAVSASGVQNVTVTGLTASTSYYLHFVHTDAAANDSTVSSSAQFTTSAAGDTTPPTLTGPTGTATGATTASGTVSTNEDTGTLYWLASANASEAGAAVKAGSSQAVSAVGTQNVTVSGLTGSTAYYLHYLHRDAAGNDSAVSTSAQFTTSAAGDTTAPTLTGAVTFASITQTSYTASWPAGSDNVAVTGYEYQIGGTAGAWTDAGNNLSAAITGRTAGTTETVYVRAYDAAGLRSTPAISGSVTLLSATTDGTITVGSALYPIKYSSASVLNEPGLRATVLDATTLAQVLNTSGVVCNAGVITITDAALVIGGTYHLAVKTASGWTGFSDVVTAS